MGRESALRAGIAVAIAVVCLSACGGQSSSSPAAATPAATAAGAVHSQASGPATTASGLLALHDPGEVTGTITGPCHTRDHGQLPDPSCTPGAVDPAVTQANIGATICRPGYTESVRPPEQQTETFKWNVAEPAYGQHNVSGELDHLVPLELGGDNEARNLWVEAGPLPNPKDAVEDALNRAVCDGRITLRAAQQEIASNWIKAAARLGIPVPRTAAGSQPSATKPSPARTGSGWCSATASYNSQYADWDVYIHSNQPDATATATSGPYSHHHDTNSTGYVDVYLRGPSSGQRITVTVGSAECSTIAG